MKTYEKTLTISVFVVNKAYKCVYCLYGWGKRVNLCLYVDDILIFVTNLDVIKEVKGLSHSFEMKDLGLVEVILNIKLLRDNNGGIPT
jgi:hypothetical protein